MVIDFFEVNYVVYVFILLTLICRLVQIKNIIFPLIYVKFPKHSAPL